MPNFLQPNITRAALPAKPCTRRILSALVRVCALQRFARLLPLIAILPACSQAARSGDGRESPARSTGSALTSDGVENVINGSFTAGMAPWWSYGMLSESTTSGAYCAVSPASPNVYDAGLGQDMPLEAGVSYSFSFFVSGDPDHIHVTIQNPTTFAEYAGVDVTPTAIGGAYSATFTAPETLTAKIVFQVASAAGERSFCVDDVSLLGGVAPPVYTPDTGPRVRVNQVAYLDFGPKHATLVTAQAESVPWDLQDAQGSVLMSGQSAPLGSDASSALTVQDIDFSGFGSAGEGLTLVADGETSFPFAIAGGHYQDLRVDALRVFYTQRSGQAIDGAVAGAAYARPAGHVSAPGTGSVNQGDLAVPCQPADISLPIYGEAWTCDYTLDVEGGWYDAGDHGKYVVNGGIAVYQLLSAFERTKLAPSTHLGALADGTLHVPEAANGVPDVLDEARHELEFFLKMQVPAGKPLSGMVHHKVHDSAWTGLPLAPERDAMSRWLHRPSTAATLNLTATAAQGARIYAPYDRAFAKKLLAAALNAWRAAQANPALFAPPSDGASGGGAYDDSNVSDEFYWAAAELYLTTGKAEFRDFVLNSPLHSAEVFTPEGFYWGSVAALARLDLASIPSALPGRASVVASVVAAAHRYLDDQAQNPFGQPYLPSGGYAWGSNSQVLNNLVVLGTAYDLTGDTAYQRGVLRGIDYLFGRNALNVSYVTGYGTVFSHNQHTRLYAHELDPTLPNPPGGTLAGGPNSFAATWDPLALRLFSTQGCAPQFCYVDDIQSYATNELAINWNSALAWVASFVADQEARAAEPTSRCTVAYTRLLPPRVALAAAIQLKNTGTTPIDSWHLSWSFLGDESVQVALGARVKQAGATVSVSALGPNRTIKPGKSLTFYVVGPGGELADPDPTTFFLNGSACLRP